MRSRTCTASACNRVLILYLSLFSKLITSTVIYHTQTSKIYKAFVFAGQRNAGRYCAAGFGPRGRVKHGQEKKTIQVQAGHGFHSRNPQAAKEHQALDSEEAVLSPCKGNLQRYQ